MAKEFIENVTSFNEEINYHLSTLGDDGELNVKLVLGAITGFQESTQIGEINLKVESEGGTITSNTTMDSLVIESRRLKLNLENVNYKTVASSKDYHSSFNIDDLQFHENNDLINIRDLSFDNKVNSSDLSSVDFDWSIGSFDLNSASLIKLSNAKMGVSAKISGYNTAYIEELRDVISHGDTKRYEQLSRAINGDGYDISDFKFYLNNNEIIGDLSVEKTDYTNMSSHDYYAAFGNAIKSELDFTMTPMFKETVKANQNDINKYWTLQDDGNYTTKVKVSDGNITANGKIIR